MKIFILKIHFLAILLFFLSLFALEPISHAAILKWDANSEVNLAGYRVYYGTSSRNYDSFVDVGNVTECELFELLDLNEDLTYCIALTAYNTSDNESKKSNEVCIHFISTQNFYIDNDCDGIPDDEDNCPDTPNGPVIGTCVKTIAGVVISYRVGEPEHFITCNSNEVCETADPDGSCQIEQGDCNNNEIGDVCECYADSNEDGTVSVWDYIIYKQEFGRSCSEGDPCQADYNEDGTVTVWDYIIFKQDFGRFGCPACD